MEIQKKENKINFIIEFCWLTVFFLLPLFFTTLVHGVWQISKSGLFQILVEIMFFLWLIKIIQKKNFFQKILIKIKPLLPAIIFILILGLATFFSKTPYSSFWGYYDRKMGYLIWLHYFIFFLILFFNLKKEKQLIRIFQAIAFSSFFVSIYGLLQLLGLDPFSWSEPSVITQRIFSTFGQPNFLASWLLFSWPIFLYLIYFQKRSQTKNDVVKNCWKIFYSFGLALNLIALFFTQSRAGWLAFFLSLLFLIFIILIKKRKKFFIKAFLILVLIFFISIVFLNFYPLSISHRENILIQRIKTLSHLGEAGKLRMIWWRHAWDLIRKKPILGYGLETQYNIFAPYYQPEYGALEAINSMPDRAHNDFLDITLVAGFLGLASYLFLLAIVFIKGLKKFFSKLFFSDGLNLQLMIPFILTGLLGYLISIQFSFHTTATAVYFWVYLALSFKIIYGDFSK